MKKEKGKEDKVIKLIADEGKLLIRERELGDKSVIGLTEVWLGKNEKPTDYTEIPIIETQEEVE